MIRADWPALGARVAALTGGEGDAVALMATVACEVFHADDRFDWVGFYRVVAPGLLKIGPYQGGHGCLTIPFARGVCGAAARTGQVQLVDDVAAFPGHIACAAPNILPLPVRKPNNPVVSSEPGRAWNVHRHDKAACRPAWGWPDKATQASVSCPARPRLWALS